MTDTLSNILNHALERRAGLTCRLLQEKTDCWRILNGEADQRPGLTIDRYGSLILVQVFYNPPSSQDAEIIRKTIDQYYHKNFIYQYKVRTGNRSEAMAMPEQTEIPASFVCLERGIKYHIAPGSRGLDPQLFLDTRVARDYICRQAGNRSLLNLFAYTCSVGIRAAACGASEVWNIDFSQSALDTGKINRRLNCLEHKKIEFFKTDAIAATRQFAGLGIKGRARRHSFLRFKPRKFDLVFLDPPTVAKGKFGSIDIINDYQSIFKPAMLCVAPGGTIVATHHHHSVDQKSWLELLKKSAGKAGKEIMNTEVLKPHGDFCSIDGRHPLKIAALTIR